MSNIQDSTEKLVKLKSTPESWINVYWATDPVMEEIFKDGIVIQDEKVKHLVQELDRRFAQLWQKVRYERKD